MRLKKIIFILLITTTSVAQEPVIDAGAEVLEIANSYIGKRIKTGICWQFVHKVLVETGNTVSLSDSVEIPLPGDIYVTNGIYDSVVPLLDEGYVYEYQVYGGKIGPHVAIISKVLGDHKFEILDQNSKGRRNPVTKRIIDISVGPGQTSLGCYFLRPKKGIAPKHKFGGYF